MNKPVDTRELLVGQTGNLVREYIIIRALQDSVFSVQEVCNEAAKIVQHSQWCRVFYLSTALVNGWSEQEINESLSALCGGDYWIMERLKEDFPKAQEYRPIREQMKREADALKPLETIGQDATN